MDNSWSDRAVLLERPSLLAGSSWPDQAGQLDQAGQAGVITLLTMVVILTIALSLGTRTTQDLSLSRQQAESSRVFNAAEAGVEDALSQIKATGTTGPTNVTIDNTTVSVTTAQLNRFDSFVFEGNTVTVDLTGAAGGDTVRLRWDKRSNCATDQQLDKPASLVVSIFYQDAGTTRVRHQGLEACDHGDGFETSTAIDIDGMRWQRGVSLPAEPLFMRVRPVYNDTHLKVEAVGGWSLPAQGFKVRSQAGNDLGDEVRIVEADRSLETSPSIFDFTLYSGTSLIK
ncbi:MAG: hypothetical protein COU69_00970 [Candidatus Pacebacteria bacterium CG10_big_fil_rev_8_21_14_0_10_56_10]|nr:MAG: hypothetical protein COU69_00970 [Candidatus Pacebacteria bacterium CG10_big_fil_rev_8_21_14_0_10_56_10]